MKRRRRRKRLKLGGQYQTPRGSVVELFDMNGRFCSVQPKRGSAFVIACAKLKP